MRVQQKEKNIRISNQTWSILNHISSLISAENLSFFNGLYDKPWARLSPYIFGICIGYVIHKIETRLEISIGMMVCGMYTTKQ